MEFHNSKARLLPFGLSSVLLLVFTVAAHANVTGSDIQNFNPTTNGIDFVTVQSSETLDPGIINVGFFLNFAVNTMPNYENVTTQSRTDFNDTLLGGDINIGVGLQKNWDIGFSAPQVYLQETDDDNNVASGEISQTGLTEYRFNTKYRFFGDADHGLATILSVNLNQTRDNPFTGTNPGPTWNLELAYDTTVKGIAYGVNAGVRLRDPGTPITPVTGIPVEPFKDQFIASVAASYLLNKYDVKLIGEIFGSFPMESQDTTGDRDVSTMELLLGLKKDLRHDIAIHAGAGTEIYHGSSSPDWRIYTGINWNFGPLFGEAEQQDARVITPESVEIFASKPLEGREKFVAGDVLFAFDSAELSPQFENALRRMAEYLERGRGFKTLTVDGHTDSVGPEAYNLDLSQRRAASVRKFLVQGAGLPANKVRAEGYGETRPVADNGNYQGRAKNRRVEFNITR